MLTEDPQGGDECVDKWSKTKARIQGRDNSGKKVKIREKFKK